MVCKDTCRYLDNTNKSVISFYLEILTEISYKGVMFSGMKRFIRTVATVLLITIALSSLEGCFDRRELDTLGIVLGVAIDKAETQGDIELTLQFVNSTGHRTGKSDGTVTEAEAVGIPYFNISNTGKNSHFIVRDMQNKLCRKIYLAHNEAIVFSDELARTGVRDCLDFFARASEARMTVYILVAKGKAKEILEVRTEFEKMPIHNTVKLIKDQEVTSQTPIISEFEFVSKIISKTTAAIAPIIDVIEEDDKQKITCVGCAVFKECVMVGELDNDQTRGLLFVIGGVKSGVIGINVLGTTATMHIGTAKSRVTPILYDDGSMLFKVVIDETGSIGDQSGTVNLADPDNTYTVLRATEEAIKAEIQSAINKSIVLNADIFGFGDAISRRYPDQWEQMKGKWDVLYRNIKVDITVQCEMDKSGRIAMPLIPADE